VCCEVLYAPFRPPDRLPTPHPARPNQPPGLARLLLTDATTIAELHAIIQIAFGWSDSHLHQFVIHGKHYGIAYLGGVSFADNPDRICLADFRFRAGEHFFYKYNFHVPWRHEIRVEQIGSPVPGQPYPVCVNFRIKWR